ncbi:hypothetical protein B9Z55_000617 [Caenorhabditis nigoni]|uniref:Uncharacterized protein n=1 Tax=Caenorhabditis nigoni TaxID=1611254 RepID=A0A2G5VU06_9PELO|nr:hypothetical protein B9Z55_000617 [Caenorhabditis nigoni]
MDTHHCRGSRLLHRIDGQRDSSDAHTSAAGRLPTSLVCAFTAPLCSVSPANRVTYYCQGGDSRFETFVSVSALFAMKEEETSREGVYCFGIVEQRGRLCYT